MIWLTRTSLASALVVSAMTGPGSADPAEELLLLTRPSGFAHFEVANGGAQDRQDIAVVRCAMDRMDQPFRIEYLPLGRALGAMRAGQAEGVITEITEDDIHQIATMSVPLLAQDWAWFVPDGADLDPNTADFQMFGIVGAVVDSGACRWLNEQGYTVAAAVRSADQLAHLLQHDRVQAVLASTNRMAQVTSQMKLEPVPWVNRDESRYRLGVYFDPAFLAMNAGFLERFNAQVRACHQLDGAE